MPAAVVHKVLDEQFGRSWRERFRSFDDVPAAAASIGQVHRAVWADGRDVAVKLQYPGRGARPDGRLHPALAHGAAVLADLPRARGQAAAGRAQGTGVRGTRLLPRGRRAARLRGRLRRRPRHRRPPRGGQRTQGDGQRVDGRHAAVADHRRRHPGAARPRRHPARPAALQRAGAGRPAARRPAPGQLPDAGRRSARRRRFRRRRAAAGRLSRAAGPVDPLRRRRATAPRCSRCCGPKGSCAIGSRWTPRRS